ncbi:MAG: flagellar hook-associated protein FlgK [Alphaproteobacteria bacterium]
MGLSSLDAALSGLRVAQQQISVISNNVSNVNTPGFTRKILPQTAQVNNGVAVGVLGQTIIRKVDLNLGRDLWTQVSAVGMLEVRNKYLSRIEQFHGDPRAELSVAAELSRLQDSFSALSDSPGDSFAQSDTVNRAVVAAQKINDLSNLIMRSRNDAQDELAVTITRVNQLLEQIADLNDTIQNNLSIGRSTAVTEDKRDEAIKELAELIDISFFVRGDGVMVVQTRQGVELADIRARKIEFRPTPLGAGSYYPVSAAGLYVVDKNFSGDAATSPTAINITERNLGGRIGGLLELRDRDFPQQLAQLDELAHKLALRFDTQGLRLFTDATGNIPDDTPPDPSLNPPQAVGYLGFSSQIRVNQAVLNDNSLVQKGTYGATIQSGSNEVIRRVIEFTFGSVSYQQAFNDNPDTQVDLVNTGGLDLQSWLGLFTSNSVTAARTLSGFVDPDGPGGLSAIDVLVGSAGGLLDDPNDQFSVTFDQPGLVPAASPLTITIDLSAVPQTGANAAEDIVNHINDLIALAAPDSRLNASAAVGPNGEIVFRSSANITIDASIPNGMGQDGLTHLGLLEGTTNAVNHPYFDVQVGNDSPVRITIEPGDTAATLISKLQGIGNLAVRLNGDVLELRPGDDDGFINQSFGGDIKIIGGPFSVNGAGYGSPPAAGVRTTIDNGVNITSALFGTYSINSGVITNTSPVTSVSYESETSTGSGINLTFRDRLLGPNAAISTGIVGATRLTDFAQKMINQQSSTLISIRNAQEDEQTLRDVLQTQLLNESGVNLDEELANLIVYQTSFSAAARVVKAVDEMFQELLNAF